MTPNRMTYTSIQILSSWKQEFPSRFYSLRQLHRRVHGGRKWNPKRNQSSALVWCQPNLVLCRRYHCEGSGQPYCKITELAIPFFFWKELDWFTRMQDWSKRKLQKHLSQKAIGLRNILTSRPCISWNLTKIRLRMFRRRGVLIQVHKFEHMPIGWASWDSFGSRLWFL